MAAPLVRVRRSSSAVNVLWRTYITCSVLLLVALYLDPYFNRPSGWIALELFTREPVRHGVDPCAWDYDGSWKIGSFSGPGPMALNTSEEPLITCADVTARDASFVRAPFLHIPGDGEQLNRTVWTLFYEMRDLRTYSSVIGASVSRDGGSSWQAVGVALADRHVSYSSPFVVYDAPSSLYIMLPDARLPARGGGPGALPRRNGIWAYVTTTAEFPLGWQPLTPDTLDRLGGSAADASTQAAAAPAAAGMSAAARGRAMLQRASSTSGRAVRSWGAFSGTGSSGSGSGSGSSSGAQGAASVLADVAAGRWGPPPEHGASFGGTTAVQFEGRWWIFTSLLRTPLLPWLPPRVTPRIYTAEGSLLSPWAPHPVSEHPGLWSLASAAAPSEPHRTGPPQSAGRPFVWQGAIYRWTQGCREQCGDKLTLMRSVAANRTHYAEEVAATYQPAGDRSWHAARLGHADVRPLPAQEGQGEGERWWGLLAADRYADGQHHFVVHEMWFVQLKESIRDLVAIQFAVVLAAVVLRAGMARVMPRGLERERSFGGGGASNGGSKQRDVGSSFGGPGRDNDDDDDGGDTGLGGDKAGSGGSEAAQRLWAAQLSRSAAGLAVRAAAEATGRLVIVGLMRLAAAWEAVAGSCRRVAAQPPVQFAAHALSACFAGLVLAAALMVVWPSAVRCPRWTVAVRPLPPPHYVPPRPFVDPAGPFNVSNLTVVTGCTASFMDRVENMVASMQFWEPHTRLAVYDLGFTSQQLAKIRCWKGVEVVRFPYEEYPPHVREISTYAFKGLVFQHALRRYGVMLWIDCGLEIRGPLDSIRATMSRDGYVSAQQQGMPGNYPRLETHMLPFLNISKEEYERIRNLPFCAAGVQGFVRGAASEQLIMEPTAACSLQLDCIAPPGHSRANYMYEQAALTLQLRRYNYSSCMPRETHCTSAVKKVSWDPTASSAPIVVASRRHRWPKPYRSRLAYRSECSPDPQHNPWRSVSLEHPETVTKSSSLVFKIAFVYGQAVGDFIIQSSCCLGFHLLAQAVLLGALMAGEVGRFGLTRSQPGGQLSPTAAAGGSWLWLCRPQPLLASLVLLVVVMAVSMTTACKAM